MLILVDKVCNSLRISKRVEGVWTADQLSDAYHWGAIPLVTKRINRLITGDENTSFGDHIVEAYFRAKAPSANALTLGCGIGDPKEYIWPRADASRALTPTIYRTMRSPKLAAARLKTEWQA